MTKSSVTLGGIPLAANSASVWRLQTGTTPYTTVFTVHKSQWEQNLKKRQQRPLDIVFQDGQGVKTTVKEVYILETRPSSIDDHVSFLVADRRWKWSYKHVTRDYNVPKRTGDKSVANPSLPEPIAGTIDEYDFRPYSLNKGNKWTPRQAVEDILKQLEPPNRPGERPPINIVSFPIEGSATAGQFTLQNVLIRDQGDVALSRLLSYIPGAEVYIDTNGLVTVFDGADLNAARQYLKRIGPWTRSGDVPRFVTRRGIRPLRVDMFYQREVECLMEYEDDYSTTTRSQPNRNAPYIENVVQTVDVETEITEFDPEAGEAVVKIVAAGTWVRFDSWLEAMDAIRPDGSAPWTFKTIQRHWVKGNLEAVLGAITGLDIDPDGVVANRVAAIRQHFRQTFRLNRRFVERIRDINAVRVAVIDPVSGARAPSAVWGQACMIPNDKGRILRAPGLQGVYTNVDFLPGSNPDGSFQMVKDVPQGPASAVMVDKDLGIFRIEWRDPPDGTVSSWVPCNLVGENNQSQPKVPTRDLSQQDEEPIGNGLKVESGTNGLFLSPKMEYKAMLTIVPAAPNNKRQYHRISVMGSEIPKLFRAEFGIQQGFGPVLEVYVPPGELTARFAWDDDDDAEATIAQMLGLDSDDPTEAGLEDDEDTPADERTNPPGFILVNRDRELAGHSKALAAEQIAPFADNVMGSVHTAPLKTGLRLVGNMSGASIQVQGFPSGKVDETHEFPGQQKPVSRFSLMSEDARRLILGVVPYNKPAV